MDADVPFPDTTFVEGSRLAHDGEFWRRLAAAGARKLPRWWMRYSPPFFGLAAAALLPEARRAVRNNLEHIRGPAPRWIDAIETATTFATYASCLSEGLARGSKNETPLRTTFIGHEHLRTAIARGKGIVLLTMHTAGWEVATPAFVLDAKLDVMVVMEGERDPRAQAIQDHPRGLWGAKVVRVGGDPLAALPILRHVENKGAVAMQMDRPPSNGRKLTVKLLGREHAVPEGPLRIAQLTGAALLPTFTARLGFNTYCGRTYSPLWLPRRASGEEIQEAAQTIGDAMGDFLRDFPTQWFHWR
jgi:KDO2-lipid IV(A) lauroyltransferase